MSKPPQTPEEIRAGKSTPNHEESLVKIITTKEEFENIIKTVGDKHLFVEFHAPWCGPCKELSMKFQELSEKYKDKVMVLKIDVDELEELAIEYEVTTMPAFVVIQNGEKLEQFFGSKTKQLDKAVEKYLGKAT